MTSQDRMITANGLTFHCRIEGAEGKPWLTFSNSMMTDLALWDAQAAALADRFRILRYDQRGHGKTVVPDVDCSFDILTEDVVALFDALGIEKSAFVGISMGSATGLRLGSRFPTRVTKLVMADGQAATAPGGAQGWEDRIVLARKSGMEALVEPTAGRWFIPEHVAANGPGINEVRRMIRTTPLEGFVRCARALQSYEFTADLAKLTMPVLLLVGAQDGAAPTNMRKMAEQIADAKLIEIDKAGHLPCIEQPAAFTAALAAFL